MIHHTKRFAFGKTLPQAEFTSAEEENIPKEKRTAPVWNLSIPARFLRFGGSSEDNGKGEKPLK